MTYPNILDLAGQEIDLETFVDVVLSDSVNEYNIDKTTDEYMCVEIVIGRYQKRTITVYLAANITMAELDTVIGTHKTSIKNTKDF